MEQRIRPAMADDEHLGTLEMQIEVNDGIAVLRGLVDSAMHAPSPKRPPARRAPARLSMSWRYPANPSPAPPAAGSVSESERGQNSVGGCDFRASITLRRALPMSSTRRWRAAS